jgi:hypothetical protein
MAAIVLVACALSSTARAEEPRGCDKFRWPVAREQAALTAAELPSVPVAGTRTAGAGAFTFALVPAADATLPMPPERSSKQTPAFAGFASFAAPPAKGLYQVTLSQGVWVDLVQNGTYLKPVAFSGALACPGVRKIVRFEVGSAPFTLQVSGAAADKVSAVVDRVPDAAD